MAKQRKTRRKFTKELEAEIVKLVLDGGRSVPDVCREQGLGESSVYRWVKQAQVDRWIEQQKLLPPADCKGSEFGASVAIEGDTALVGSLAGAHVFEARDGEPDAMGDCTEPQPAAEAGCGCHLAAAHQGAGSGWSELLLLALAAAATGSRRETSAGSKLVHPWCRAAGALSASARGVHALSRRAQ